MLASRGAVYHTRQSAGEFKHFHRRCDCKVVPGFEDDPDAELVEGYKPKELYDTWKRFKEIDEREGLSRKQKNARKTLLNMASGTRGESSNGTSSQVVFEDKQFGKKAAKHCLDWGLDPAFEEDREVFLDIITAIIGGADRIDIGNWRGQESNPCTYYLRGDDLVIIDSGNRFVTVTKGGGSNKRYRNSIASYRSSD